MEESLRRQLAALKPPLLGHPPESPFETVGFPGKTPSALYGVKLRKQHLAVITTILHRCLLDGDYIRAGRAWGLILRAEINGRGINLRGAGRWGVGAELLLKGADRPSSTVPPRGADPDSSSDEDVDSILTDITSVYCSANDLARAQDYYERLVLQYPFSNNRPHTVNTLDFYPAMFGLWIHSAQEPRRLARARQCEPNHQDLQREPASVDGDEGRGVRGSLSTISSDAPTSATHDDAEHNARMRTEHREAEAIAARMDELMVSPPYSDSSQLWKLRGMVALWLSDFSNIESLAASVGEDSQDENSDINQAIGRTEDAGGSHKRLRELETAREIFEKVQANGGNLWPGVRPVLNGTEIS